MGTTDLVRAAPADVTLKVQATERCDRLVSFTPAAVVVAGWTGRDPAETRRHIRELADLGVEPPASTPCFYRVGTSRLNQTAAVEVYGAHTSGEAEAVVVEQAGERLVTLGSDHTDRRAETFDVGLAKQACDKPLAGAAWRYADVASHWDMLELRAWRIAEGRRCLYQRGTLSALLHPDDLIAGFTVGSSTLPAATVMFCGTLPAIGGIQPAPCFEMELTDPVLGRRLHHRYRCDALPAS